MKKLLHHPKPLQGNLSVNHIEMVMYNLTILFSWASFIRYSVHIVSLVTDNSSNEKTDHTPGKYGPGPGSNTRTLDQQLDSLPSSLRYRASAWPEGDFISAMLHNPIR